jgi:hypothetical protein
MVVPAGYLPQAALTVRVEALGVDGQPDRDLWDANVTLSANAGVTLSTNQVTLRNGVGTALVVFHWKREFHADGFSRRPANQQTDSKPFRRPVTTVGGTLPGTTTTWTGVINVTNDVTVRSAIR